jgi:universal stress protein A
VLGSVAEKVLRKAPCPVLAVPPHATARAPVDVRFENVLCPIDFSPASLQAFGFAMDLARQSGGSVTVLHVIEWMAEDQPRGSAVFDVPAYREHLVADARGRMKALLVGEPREGTTAIQEAVVFGRAHREVLRTASDTPPDLIVMGAQGRGGIGLALFGSTTQEVVRGAPCPVLSVRAVPAVPVK